MRPGRTNAGIGVGLLRFGVACFGLLVIGSAIADVAVPEVVHSADPAPPTTLQRWLTAALWFGYGCFLLLPPMWLARRRLLLVATAALAIAANAWPIWNLVTRSGAATPAAATLVAMFLAPLVIQAALVHRSWLEHSTSHPPRT